MRPAFADPIGPWITVFAWRPRHTYDAGWVWLCKVQKRHCQMHSYLSYAAMDWFWQYRKFSSNEAA